MFIARLILYPFKIASALMFLVTVFPVWALLAAAEDGWAGVMTVGCIFPIILDWSSSNAE